MSDKRDEYHRVFKMASALRWSYHRYGCTWIDKETPDPTCNRCKAKADWDTYINNLGAR